MWDQENALIRKKLSKNLKKFILNDLICLVMNAGIYHPIISDYS